MDWAILLSSRRMRDSQYPPKPASADLRSEFEKDYHRIIGSASFRRLQDKTQVFPLDQSDFIRTRLTHSLEVSSLAKSLGQNIGENILNYRKDSGFTPRMKEDICHILQCAGLIHDIGNPPFGHFGEIAIREWFSNNLSKLEFFGTPVTQLLSEQMLSDLYHFEGNAQALRLVTKLHYLVDEHGMNLTFALLNTIIKYPVSSLVCDSDSENIRNKKPGYYLADQPIMEEITKATGTYAGTEDRHHTPIGVRHPLTYILEAADDLAYLTADIEDAFVKGYISYYRLLQELQDLKHNHPESNYDAAERLQSLYQRGVAKQVPNPEAYAVKNWIIRIQGFLINCATYGFTSNYNAIMDGTYSHDLFHHTFGEPLIHLLGDMAYRHVFSSSDIYKMEMIESFILNFLMDKFIHAALYYDTDKKMNTIDLRFISLISDNYKTAYKRHAVGKSDAEKLYLRLLLVTDYICGMTDSYAKRLYQELTGK